METSTYDELEVSVVLVSELVDVVVALFDPESPVLEVASDVMLVLTLVLSVIPEDPPSDVTPSEGNEACCPLEVASVGADAGPFVMVVVAPVVSVVIWDAVAAVIEDTPLSEFSTEVLSGSGAELFPTAVDAEDDTDAVLSAVVAVA